MNTGQTVYEQLQDMLNKCIELGWKPRLFEKGFDLISMSIDRKEGVYIDKHIYFACYDDRQNNKYYELSFHELFSKDSGIMEFVEWKPLEKASSIQLKILYEYGLRDYNYIMMSLLTAQEKVEYFIENARVPTK